MGVAFVDGFGVFFALGVGLALSFGLSVNSLTFYSIETSETSIYFFFVVTFSLIFSRIFCATTSLFASVSFVYSLAFSFELGSEISFAVFLLIFVNELFSRSMVSFLIFAFNAVSSEKE